MKDNAARLARLKKEFAAFLKDIYPGREKVAVFGEGNAYARVMLVGEAPGQQETLAQRPFVGKAGKNLDEFCAKASFSGSWRSSSPRSWSRWAIRRFGPCWMIERLRSAMCTARGERRICRYGPGRSIRCIILPA